MSRLTPAQQAVLDALWEVPGSRPALAAEVRAQAARMGHWRALSSIRRTLDQLVDLSCARRIMVRRGEHDDPRAYYYATSRAGEELPAAYQDSKFITALFEVRHSWRAWTLMPAERTVWVEGLGLKASALEWAWLASRNVLLLDEHPVPDDPAWWDDADSDVPGLA